MESEKEWGNFMGKIMFRKCDFSPFFGEPFFGKFTHFGNIIKKNQSLFLAIKTASKPLSILPLQPIPST